MKRVALLVPCYNAARFVPRFLAMVRAQTRAYDEVLFYDDGSVDDTALALIKGGATVLRGQANRGPSHARNQLLSATTAEYVHLHDIDDELDREFVATLLPSAAPDCASCCALRRSRPDGSVEREDRHGDLPEDTGRIAHFLQRFLSFNATIYPRARLLQLGGFNERLRISEDLHLLLRAAADGVKFAYHDRVLTTWWLRPDSSYHSAGARGASLATLDCLADLCAKWDVELCRELGPTLLEMAWTFRTSRDAGNALRAARLAQRCGQRVIANRGRRVLWLSRLLGPAGYYRVFASRPMV